MGLVKFFFDLFLILLSVITPKKKNSFLLGAGHGRKFIGNPKYFYLYLLERGNVPVLWITENRAIFDEFKGRKWPVVYKFSFSGVIAILRSKYFIIEQMPRDILFSGIMSSGRFTYIQTFHGIAIKKIGIDAGIEQKGIARFDFFNSKKCNQYMTSLKTFFKKYFLYNNYDLIVATSEMVKLIILSAFGNSRIEVLGCPRNDILLGKEVPAENQMLEKLKKYDKVIGYIPTFRDNYENVYPFSDTFLRVFDGLLAERNWIFIVKKHPYERNINIPENLRNIFDMTDSFDDVQELLLAADILITDYSSVINDFCLMDRPIIFYPYDLDEYIDKCRGMYYSYYDTFSGPFVIKEEELIDLVFSTDSWFNSPEYKKKYQEMKSFFNYYTDDKSSERLYNFIVNKYQSVTLPNGNVSSSRSSQ